MVGALPPPTRTTRAYLGNAHEDNVHEDNAHLDEFT